MNLDLKNARKNNNLTDEQKNLLASKSKKIKNELALNKWHDVVATIKGDELSCAVNGKFVGSFTSPGFAHSNKRVLRLIVAKDIHIDDVKIWRKK